MPNPIAVDRMEPSDGRDASVSAYGELDVERKMTKLYELNDTLPSGDWKAPEFGRDHEEGYGPQRPIVQHRHIMGYHDQGAWSRDDFNDQTHIQFTSRALVEHYGYQEAWGVDLPNDREYTLNQRIPWDYGLEEPAVTAPGQYWI